jgi:GWxTD domain-containing protein
VEARNLVASGYNTQVFFSHVNELLTPTEVHIGFREAGKEAFKLQDQFFVLPDQAFPLKKNYQLPAGTYQLEFTSDEPSSPPVSITYECNNQHQALFASDIYLSDAAFPKNPNSIVHSSQIETHQEALFFRCELLSERYQLLTARAVLYRDRTQGTQAHATVFTSIEQQNKVLSLSKGKAIFEGQFNLDELKAGDYLLEVLIFEDDQLLRERSVRFSKAWEGYAGLMANPDRAIEMLAPIAEEADIQQMLRITEEAGKRAAFENWWETYTSESQSLQMATYYQKLLEADSLFSDTLPAWKSDRGRAYLLYGKPNRQELVKRGVRYERWYYEEWNLVLWFREEGANFVSIN